MTRQHFNAIAADIKSLLQETPTQAERFGIWITCERLAYTFKAINPRFDAERFFDACGFARNADRIIEPTWKLAS